MTRRRPFLPAIRRQRGALALSGNSGNSGVIQSGTVYTADPPVTPLYEFSPRCDIWQDAAGTTPGANGQPVGGWDDYLGADRAANVTAGAYPTLIDDGSGPNGFRFVRSDGGDRLITLGNLGYTGNIAKAVLCIVKSTLTATGCAWAMGAGGTRTAASVYHEYPASADEISMQFGNSSLTAGTMTNDAWHAILCNSTGSGTIASAWTVNVDGTYKALGANTDTLNLSDGPFRISNTINGLSYWKGDMLGFYIFPSLSASERTDVIAWAQGYYGV